MSRLRTSSPWTTPTTPLGARILSEEPATVDAIPTMTLAEMEAALAGPVTVTGRRAPGRSSGRPSLRRLAAVAAVLVALAGCAGGLTAAAGGASRPGPDSGHAASAASEVAAAPDVAAAWGEAMALSAPGPVATSGAGSASVGSADALVVPASVERVHASLVGPGDGSSASSAAAAMGDVVGRSVAPSTTLAAAYP